MALDKDGKEIVETAADEAAKTDAELEAELAELEANKGNAAPAAPAPERTELEKATFNLKSNLKRVKDLGGDPATILGEEIPAKTEPQTLDTSEFVTKKDLLKTEAERVAKSPAELKLILWYVNNKGMSVEDAHFMANKNRIKKTLGEVGRSEGLVHAAPGAGAGNRPAEKPEVPDLPQSEKSRLLAAGMIYDPAKMAYVGKKVQHKYDPVSKTWTTVKL